jgi:hypothetical protein
MVAVGALLRRLHWLRGDIARAEQMSERYAYLADEFPSWRAAAWFFRGFMYWDQQRIDQVLGAMRGCSGSKEHRSGLSVMCSA